MTQHLFIAFQVGKRNVYEDRLKKRKPDVITRRNARRIEKRKAAVTAGVTHNQENHHE